MGWGREVIVARCKEVAWTAEIGRNKQDAPVEIGEDIWRVWDQASADKLSDYTFPIIKRINKELFLMGQKELEIVQKG